MRGLRFLRHVGIAVPVAIAAASVAAMAPAATPPALAFNGGDAQWNAVDLPCAVPCSFLGDNTGDGLSPFPTDTAGNEHATWWTFVADASTSHTVHAAAVAPASWHTTLVLTDLDGTVLAADDDPYGRDAAVTATLTAGNGYLLALAGHAAGDQGTAQITLTTGTPDAPIDLTAAPRTGAALLGWTAPDDHGSAITEYRVYVDGNTTYTAVPAPATSTTIGGLTIGTGVTFTVTAVNTAGESARTAPTSAVVPYGPTTTTVAFSPAGVTYPATFDVIATVTAAVPVNDGVVTFWRNGVSAGSASVTAGTARLARLALSPGTYSFVANYGGSIAFGSSGGAGDIVVAKAAQVLTFAAIADTDLAVGTFTVTPTSAGPVAITVTSSTTGVCTVRNRVVTLLTPGTCSLTASQAGNSLYAAATSVTRSFSVLDLSTTTTTSPPTTTTTSPPTTTTEPPTTTTTSTTTTTTSTTTTTTEPPTTTTTTTEPPATTTTEPPATTTSTTTTTTAPPTSSSTSTTTEPTTTTSTTTTTEPTTTTSTTTTSTSTTTTTTVPPPPPPAAPVVGAIDPRRIAAPSQPLTPGRVLAVRVTGMTGLVPAEGVGAVSVVLTVGRGATGGHLTAYACGTRPGVATVTFTPWHAAVVTALVAVDPLSGRVCVVTDSPAMVRIDLRGWMPERGGFHPVRATRLFDTRTGAGARPVTRSALTPGRALRVHVVGIDGQVPLDGVAAVSLAITVAGPVDKGVLTVWACGPRPPTVSLAFTPGEVATTLSITPVDAATGDICLAVNRTAHVVADLTGWLEPGHGYTAVSARLLDTRPGTPARLSVKGAIDPMHPRAIGVAHLLPAGSATAFVTVLVVPSAASGTLTFAVCDAAGVVRGTPTTVSFQAAQAASTTVVVRVGSASERWCITSTRPAHVVVDVHGVVVPPTS